MVEILTRGLLRGLAAWDVDIDRCVSLADRDGGPIDRELGGDGGRSGESTDLPRDLASSAIHREFGIGDRALAGGDNKRHGIVVVLIELE